jgi:hypothetical protein
MKVSIRGRDHRGVAENWKRVIGSSPAAGLAVKFSSFAGS